MVPPFEPRAALSIFRSDGPTLLERQLRSVPYSAKIRFSRGAAKSRKVRGGPLKTANGVRWWRECLARWRRFATSRNPLLPCGGSQHPILAIGGKRCPAMVAATFAPRRQRSHVRIVSGAPFCNVTPLSGRAKGHNQTDWREDYRSTRCRHSGFHAPRRT